MDITIVCGRRPELLAQTLASFSDRVLRHFPIGTVYANIDPFCGTEEDGEACEVLLRKNFSAVVVRRPPLPSFGMAVKYLWQQPKTPYFLHMEDDWEVLSPITPELIEPRLTGKVVQVQLSKLDRPYLPKTYAFRTTWRTFLGLKYGKRVHLDRPLFGTSPSFIVSCFARQCAEQMNPDLDPEKQLYSGDTPLSDFTRAHLNHPLSGPARRAIVRDLGRPWLARRGIEKRIVNGTSVWFKFGQAWDGRTDGASRTKPD